MGFSGDAGDRLLATTMIATNASPLVARANTYIAMPNLTGYTIQADVQGARVRNDMPDMGVVANRYTLRWT